MLFKFSYDRVLRKFVLSYFLNNKWNKKIANDLDDMSSFIYSGIFEETELMMLFFARECSYVF